MIVKIKIREFLSFAIFLFLYSIVTASLFAGEKVYIEIKIDGEEIGKWVELEYHKDGKTLKKDTCYWYERR